MLVGDAWKQTFCGTSRWVQRLVDKFQCTTTPPCAPCSALAFSTGGSIAHWQPRKDESPLPRPLILLQRLQLGSTSAHVTTALETLAVCR